MSQLMFIIAFEEEERNTNPPKKKLDLVSIYLLSKNQYIVETSQS